MCARTPACFAVLIVVVRVAAATDARDAGDDSVFIQLRASEGSEHAALEVHAKRSNWTKGLIVKGVDESGNEEDADEDEDNDEDADDNKRIMGALSSGRAPGAPRCYIRAGPIRTGEGITGTLRINSAAFVLATVYGCAYVCNPNHWGTVAKHHTGGVGDLLGCVNESSVVGDPLRIASMASVSKFPSTKTVIETNENRFVVHHHSQGTWYQGSALSLKPDPNAITAAGPMVYDMEMANLHIADFKYSFAWLRQQYEAARVNAGRELYLWGKATWRIAIHFRRGDYGEQGTPVGQHLNTLHHVVKQLPWITSQNTHIIVVGEIGNSKRARKEFSSLRKWSNVTFLSEAPAVDDAWGHKRLARDLDHMASADIIVLGNRGHFGHLAPVLQSSGGVSFVPNSNKCLKDLPNYVPLDESGNIRCDFDFLGLASWKLYTAREALAEARPQMAQSDLMEPLEDALLAYRKYEAKFETGEPLMFGVAPDIGQCYVGLDLREESQW